MSKQFQVYLLPNDVLGLFGQMNSCLKFAIFPARSETSQIAPVTVPTVRVGRFTRMNCVLTPGSAAGIRLNYLEAQRTWTVNKLVSEVIEVQGCHYDGDSLKRGRFYYETSFFDEQGASMKKSKPFLDWAEELFKTVKQLLKKDPATDAYWGQGALRFKADGGKISNL